MSRPCTFYGPPSLGRCKSLPSPCVHLNTHTHTHTHTYTHTHKDTHTLCVARSTAQNTEQKFRAEAPKHLIAFSNNYSKVELSNSFREKQEVMEILWILPLFAFDVACECFF